VTAPPSVKININNNPAPAAPVYVPAPAPVYLPASSLTYVGNGVYAGPNTSAPLALNVVAAWQASGDASWLASGQSVTISVYSPVTGQWYAMTYSVVGAGTVIATGGNNAYVQF